MSNVIAFLADLATDAVGVGPDYDARVRGAGFAPDVQAALLARDAAGLARLIEAPATVFCGLFPAENEPEESPSENDPNPVDVPGEPGAASNDEAA